MGNDGSEKDRKIVGRVGSREDEAKKWRKAVRERMGAPRKTEA